jgi:endonuclease/exonuclease/phosphatase family metal-dependent hydrolase
MVSSLLTVMTWNMWFDKKNRAERTEILLNEVKHYDPDIVALQEVVQESLEIIIAKMHPTYYIIGTISPEIGYDTLLLSKFPPIEWDRYYLPKTKMGRNLLLATLQTPTRQITVGTFHLESVFFPRVKEAEELKESQLKYIYAISPLNSILMGDTNLPLDLSQSGIPPNTEPISSPYIIDVGEEDLSASPFDAHSISQPNVSNLGVGAATYCGRTNKNVKNKSIQSRLDRIYVKIKRNTMKIHFYGLTGTVTQPSDHYGVFAQIEI